MSAQAEGKYRAAKERLASAPDDLASLRAFAEASRGFDKRDEAVAAMKAAYGRRPTPELYAELRSICTFPEFQAIAKPPDTPGAGPKVQSGTGAEILPRKAFPLLLDQVIFFPVQDGQSIFILIVSAVLMTIAQIFAVSIGGLGFAASVICMGIVFGYLWTVLHASGMGEKRTRGWPDFTNPEEFGTAVAQYFIVSIICFLPAVGFLMWHPLEGVLPNLMIAILLALFGVAYYPMALMMAGFTHNSWEPLNFPSGLRSITKVPADYLICLGFFIVSYVIVTVAQVFIAGVAQKAPIPVWVALSLFAQTASVYLLIIQMRTVGLLYYAREKDLGWFQ